MEKKQERGDRQTGIFSNNITTNVTTNVTTPFELQVPENAWTILSQFANQRINGNMPRTFSVNELSLIFGGMIHINTIRAMIQRLTKKAFIKLYSEATGKTKRENRYIVTMDGFLAWNKYKDLHWKRSV